MHRGLRILRATLALWSLVAACGERPSETSLREGRYRLSLTAHTAMPEGAAPFDVKLESTLEISPLDESGALALRLVEPRFAAEEAQRADFAKAAQDLSAPFVVRFAEGRVVEHRVRPGIGAFAVATLRSITAALQAPPEGARSTLEWDSTGQYQADYVASESGYEKRKVRYAQLLGLATASTSLPQVASASTRVRVRDGAIQSVHSHEVVRSPLLQGLTIDVTSDLTLVRVGSRGGAVDAASVRALSLVLKSSDAHVDPVPRRAFDAARVAGRSFGELVAALEASAVSNKTGAYAAVNGAGVSDVQRADRETRLEKQFDAYGALVSMLRSDATKVVTATSAIRDHSRAARQLMSALVAAGHGDVLHAFVQDASLELATRRGAASALLRSELPSAATVALFTQLLADADFEEHARYGLGLFSRRLREQGQAKPAEELVSLLLTELPAAKAERHRVILLRALSNAGHPSARAAIKPFIVAESRAVREAAIEALTLDSDAEVDALYAQRLRDEQDPRVHELILRRIVQHRKPTRAVTEALSYVLAQEALHSSWRSAVDLLVAWRHTAPDALALLREVEQHSPDPTLRQLAAQHLARGVTEGA
jgi:hypothetical protein